MSVNVASHDFLDKSNIKQYNDSYQKFAVSTSKEESKNMTQQELHEVTEGIRAPEQISMTLGRIS